MSVNWQHLAGDTSRFAIKLSFERDPDGGVGSTPEESSSWGSFELWVQGVNLCDHVETGERVSAVHWYLLPLLEWLVKNWGPLFHEERILPRMDGDTGWEGIRATRFPPVALSEDAADEWSANWDAWWRRHSIQAARAGGLFPDVIIRRYRDAVELSWGWAGIAGVPEDFRFSAPAGSARFPPEEVVPHVFTVALAAAERLKAVCPDSERVLRLVREASRLSVSRHYDEYLAWLAGFGHSLAESRRRLAPVRKVWQASTEALDAFLGAASQSAVFIDGSCHAALMFGSVSPTVSTKDARLLASNILESFERGHTGPLSQIARTEEVPPGRQASWEHGYDLALEALEELVGEPGEWVDVRAVLARLEVNVGSMRLEDGSIRAVSIAGEGHRPTVLLNENAPGMVNEEAARFMLAHELCHLLFDQTRGKSLSVASGPWAPRDVERRANAFAAMFLMPPQAVRAAVAASPHRVASVKGLRFVAGRLRMGVRATLEHLGNIGQIDETERDRLRGSVVGEWAPAN